MGALQHSRGYGLSAILEVSRIPPTLYSSKILSNKTRYQQNPFLRQIVDILQELHVVHVDLTVMNDARFTIGDCLQLKISEVE